MCDGPCNPFAAILLGRLSTYRHAFSPTLISFFGDNLCSNMVLTPGAFHRGDITFKRIKDYLTICRLRSTVPASLETVIAEGISIPAWIRYCLKIHSRV